jgi:hypothetical protein
MVRKKELVSYISRWMKKDEYESTLVAEDIVRGSEVDNKFDLKEHELTTTDTSHVYPLYSYTYPSLLKFEEDEDSHLFDNMNLMEVESEPPRPIPKVLTTLGPIELAALWD